MAVGKYRPLTLTPINFSLTEGTPIPAPPDSPPESVHPPTPGAGPLSSHPTPNSPAFPQLPESPQRAESEDSLEDSLEDSSAPSLADSSADSRLHRIQTNDAASSILSPTSPSSRPTSPPRRPSSSRKFWGMRSLSSSDGPKSERPASPATVHSQTPSLQRRKSGSWFGKIKAFSSSYNGTPEENVKPPPPTNGYAAPRPTTVTPAPRPMTTTPTPRPIPVTPAPQPRPVTQPKRRDPPPPALPELRSFGVGEDTFSLGAEDMFKNIK